MASEGDLARLRAAAIQMALDGDVEGAAGIAAVHDMVKGKAKPPKEDKKPAKGKK